MESTETSQEIPDENYSTLPFSHQDPLGLNDLTESQGPTYNYSLDDGLHNFVIPVSSNSSSQYVIASNSFSLAPIAKKFKQGIFIFFKYTYLFCLYESLEKMTKAFRIRLLTYFL